MAGWNIKQADKMDLPSQPSSNSTAPCKVIEFKPTKRQWQQLTSIARFKWKKLTGKELQETKGQRQKLINLVSDRYLISRTDAAEQVSIFLRRNVPIVSRELEYMPGQ